MEGEIVPVPSENNVVGLEGGRISVTLELVQHTEEIRVKEFDVLSYH